MEGPTSGSLTQLKGGIDAEEWLRQMVTGRYHIVATESDFLTRPVCPYPNGVLRLRRCPFPIYLEVSVCKFYPPFLRLPHDKATEVSLTMLDNLEDDLALSVKTKGV